VLDRKGVILYVNKILAKTDDLLSAEVIGKPMCDLFPMKKDDHLSIQTLKTGMPILKKTVIYYTNKKKLVNSLCSSFPLYSEDKIEGVIHFSLNLQISQALLLRHNGPKFKNANQYLTIPQQYTFDSIVGNSTTLNNAIIYAKANSMTDFPVLIWAETGCGKELFAQAIHYDSHRANRPFIPINCAAIPENLLETTLFGTEKGAFTGAIENAGLIEKAEGGTLLLDELNSMSLEMQAKLLRVIQEKKIMRIGAHEEKPFNVKFISTCNIPLAQALEEKQLRIDLFYRLAVVVIEIPSLRERKSDIPLLCDYFLNKWALHPTQNNIKISDEVFFIFENYQWPGNVRELEHTIQSSLTALGSDTIIHKYHLSSHFMRNYERSINKQKYADKPIPYSEYETVPNMFEKIDSFDQKKLCLKSAVNDFEKKHIEKALKIAGYNISKAGRLLNLSSQALRYKIKKLNIMVINE